MLVDFYLANKFCPDKKLQLQYGDYLIALRLSCFGKTK